MKAPTSVVDGTPKADFAPTLMAIKRLGRAATRPPKNVNGLCLGHPASAVKAMPWKYKACNCTTARI